MDHRILLGSIRCKDCKTGYRPFTGTWFDIASIDFTEWLALVKLFDLGASARRVAKGADVRYPTALNAFDCVRHSIPYHLAESGKKLKGKIEADEARVLEAEERKIADVVPGTGRMFGSGDVHVNGIEGFWSLAKESMAKRHGVSPGKFLSYTKEMERRYDNRDEDALSLLLDCVLVANN